jgi:hypothetical protein
MPENASRLFRLEALAHIASSLKRSGRVRITTTRLRTLFIEPPLSGAIKEVEDPFPNLFVEETPFFGGAYRIFPGPVAGTSFQFRRLTESIFHVKDQWPEEFLRQMFQTIRGILAISELLAERFGLLRGTPGDSSEKGDITVPSWRKLHDMKRAVTFSLIDFQSLLRSAGVDFNQFQGLIARAGTFARMPTAWRTELFSISRLLLTEKRSL